MIEQKNNGTRTSGTDVSNLSDYAAITMKTTEGKEIKLRLYGR